MAACDETGRRYYYSSTVNATDDGSDENLALKRQDEVLAPCHQAAANLLSSSCLDGHKPVIDLDHDALRLVPSSTRGHFHLYIDKKMTFNHMMGILQAFANAGLVEQSWVNHVKNDGQAFVRPPHVKKPWTEDCDNAF